jgi:leucyl-tRNA synthetase
MITGKSYFFKIVKFQGNESLKERTYIISENKEWEDLQLRPKNTLFAETYLRFKYGHQFVDSNGRLTKKAFEKYCLENPEEYSLYTFTWDKDNNEEFIYVKEESEKMSKSKFNVDNPDDLVSKYGADTFRMYEMFLGPVEQSKPWDTKGIEGVHRFLKKLWRLFFNEEKGNVWTQEKATPAELKVLHKTIKKIEEDTERFSFNTAVSAFMVCVNELTDLKCNKKEILEPLLILLTPYAPHITEELYHALGNTESILNASYPKLENKYLTESEKEYPISINGKMRTTMVISLDATQQEIEKIVLNNDVVQKWTDGKTPKKIIYVKNKMVNVVV